jgi:hypothetical protein
LKILKNYCIVQNNEITVFSLTGASFLREAPARTHNIDVLLRMYSASHMNNPEDICQK